MLHEHRNLPSVSNSQIFAKELHTSKTFDIFFHSHMNALNDFRYPD
jgi:hypothetical protein